MDYKNPLIGFPVRGFFVYARYGYLRVAKSRLVTSAMSNDRLRRTGYVFLMDCYLKWVPRIGIAVCRTACTVM